VRLGVAAALAAAWAAGAVAQQPYDPAAAVANFDKAPWREDKVELPGYPKLEKLIRFNAGRTNPFQFFVDGASLSVGPDGVVRFTVVARSETATNVSYEGIRCRTAERKIYAYGRPDASWYEPRNAEWVKIGNEVVEGYRYTLYQDYFCPAREIIKTAAEGVEALKRGGHPRADDFSNVAPMPR